MSIQDQLQRDIAQAKEAVVVTESDLWEARETLEERIEVGSRSDRRRSVALVAAAAVLIAGVGVAAFQLLPSDDQTSVPAGPNPNVDINKDYLLGVPPTPELIDGFWRLDNGTISMLFDQDGTVQIDDKGSVYSDPGAWGTYEIEGDTITMTFAGGAGCEGTQQAMPASLTPGGTMRTIPLDPSGGDCTPIPTYQSEWEHIVPTAPGIAGLRFSGEPNWQPLGDQALNGDWAAEGGGYVLEMTPQGQYYILDEAATAIDHGQWRLHGTNLLLWSGPSSAQCEEGHRLVLGDVETVNPGTPAIRGTLKENSCGGDWTPKTWYLIPNASTG